MQDTAASIFFQKLFSEKSIAYSVLLQLLGEADENEWREFKEADFIDAPLPIEREKSLKELKRREDTIKEYWSENLSAFSNSGGGVLIWGIRTLKNIAASLSLARNAVALADRLKELQNNMVEPPVLGVEVRAVLKPGSEEGFVVCHIPNSDFSPHRATKAKREYYIRSNDSNQPMRTEVLRKMFYPKCASKLVPRVTVSIDQDAEGLFKIHAAVQLKNTGSASAEEAYIQVIVEAGKAFNLHPADSWQERKFSGNGFQYLGSIHPDEEISFLRNIAIQGGYQMRNDFPEILNYIFIIYTKSSSAIRAKTSFTKDELSDAALQLPINITREARMSLLELV